MNRSVKKNIRTIITKVKHYLRNHLLRYQIYSTTQSRIYQPILLSAAINRTFIELQIRWEGSKSESNAVISDDVTRTFLI